MKRILTIFLILIISVSALCGCGASGALSDRAEVYNFDFGYYFFVPKEYEEKISEISVGNTTIVQYTEQVMLMVQAENYYSSLSDDEKRAHSRSDYYYGSELFNSTFNDTDYMLDYFEKHIQSIVTSKRINQISIQQINNSTYWVCDYTLFDQKVNTATMATEEIYKGEGKIYFHIENGFIYLITVSANEIHLSSFPDALNFINNFHIGTKNNSLVFYIWLIIGILIIVTLIWVLRSFVTIELEDVTAETATLQLDSIKEMFKDSRYYSNTSPDNELLYYRLDCILGRNDDEAFDMSERIEQNKIVMQKLDELLEAQNALDRMPDTNKQAPNKAENTLLMLDEILGRKEDDVKVVEDIKAISEHISKEKSEEKANDFEDTIPVRNKFDEEALLNVNGGSAKGGKTVDSLKNKLFGTIKSFGKGISERIVETETKIKQTSDERKQKRKNEQKLHDEIKMNAVGNAEIDVTAILDSIIREEKTDITVILDSILRNEK